MNLQLHYWMIQNIHVCFLLVTCERMYQDQHFHPLATLAQLCEDLKLAGQPHKDSFTQAMIECPNGEAMIECPNVGTVGLKQQVETI